MAEQIVIGIDGGGTTTRAAAADLSGRILATAETRGSNPGHAPNAEENARNAIRQVIDTAGCSPADVASLVAGLAGLDQAGDLIWADRFTTLPGLSCPRMHVNDAVVAHVGALRGKPGIIAVSGTGSIVFGVTETGRQVRNYDFANYAASASRHLAYESLFRIIAGEHGPDDRDFANSVLQHWGVPDIKALGHLASHFTDHDRQTRNYRAGEMAPLVTDAASSGSPLARTVCDEAALQLALSIRLVGSCFEGEVVSVVLIGGVARSNYISRAVERFLGRAGAPHYHIVEPALSAVAGALLMALESSGVIITDEVIARMDSPPAS